MLRKLDCIAGKIKQDLTQPQGIATQHYGQVCCQFDPHFQAFIRHLVSKHRNHIVEHCAKSEITLLENHLVSLDFRDIQHVIDDCQQVPR